MRTTPYLELFRQKVLFVHASHCCLDRSSFKLKKLRAADLDLYAELRKRPGLRRTPRRRR